MKQFKSLLEFVRYFDTEQKCKDYLALKRWNGSPVCPHCGHDRVYKTNIGYKCASNKCYKKFSVTKGTIYEASNIPLTKWFLAEYLMINHKKGISSYQLSRDLQVTQKSAWFMLHRIREQMSSRAKNKIVGTVEVDETFVGGRVGNKHKWQREILSKKGEGYVHRQPVLGILERGGEVRTFKVNEVNGETLKPIILDNLQWGANLITDGFGAYRGLDKFYYHTVINHAQDVWIVGDKHTNTLEGFWSHLKRGINGIYHHVSPKHLHRYCNEFAHRWNTRKLKDYDRVELGIGMAHNCRLSYKQLIAS